MCGICGFYTKRVITKEQLRQMNDSMIHRGPDDSGEDIFELPDGYSIGMAHRRLSIIDLSAAGHQPMYSADNRVAVVFNGEIYNHLQLRRQLEDYPFRSNSDTEVILAAYLRWGSECVKQFEGMYAIALYDRESEELYLLRDRIGKKPLYYWLEDGNLVFASELKAILNCSYFNRQINLKVLPRYLVQSYINAPETIFMNVLKVEPGSIVRFRRGEISHYKYWSIADEFHKGFNHRSKSYNETKMELCNLIKKAVRKRMIADVPYGCFLSGGYDSSLVAAIAQQELGKDKLRTYSIGFEEDDYNEAPQAKRIAEYLGTDHQEIYCSEKDMLDLVECIPVYFDEPFADSSQIPSMLISQFARRDITVALTGDGGDELFCGYNVYDYVKTAQYLDGIGAVLSVFLTEEKQKELPIKVRAIVQNRDSKTKTQFSLTSYTECASHMVEAYSTLAPKYDFEDKYQVSNWQIRRMLLDMDTYLPGDILTKVDRSSMKYSLECRCPLLDQEVIEYSFRIDHKLKYRKGEKKYILKQLSRDFIPRELLEGPKKGFAIPLDQWLRSNYRERLQTYSSVDYLRNQAIFNAENTHSFIRQYLQKGDKGVRTGQNFSRICWAFLVFQMWWEKYKKMYQVCDPKARAVKV